MKSWGRLLRLSLAPTAAADIAAGVAAGAGRWPGGAAPWLLVLASLAVYHGGMVLNDWADRGEDESSRPDRPIPSGAVPEKAALGVGLALLAVGPLLALAASRSSAIAMLAVALAALLYDLTLRGPWIGPATLAFCRGGNLAAGLLLGAGGEPRALLFLPAVIYAAYVFSVSRLARLEDASEAVRSSASPSLHLALAAVFLAAAPCAAVLHEAVSGPRTWVALVLAATGGVGLLDAARRKGPWSGGEITRATGLALRRLLVFTSAVALSAGGSDGWTVSGAILLGYPISFALRGVFPPS